MKYNCISCKYSTNNKTNFNKHLMTQKCNHLYGQNGRHKGDIKNANILCEEKQKK